MTKNKNVLEISDFFPLLQGEETEKMLLAQPTLLQFEDMPVTVNFVCGVDLGTNSIKVFLRINNLEQGYAGRFDILLVPDNAIDPLWAYRLMDLIGELWMVDFEKITSIISLPIEWENYKNQKKIEISKQLGLSKKKINLIMTKTPFDLEETILSFQERGIIINPYLIQKAVLNSQIEISPFYRELGIKTASEIAAEKKQLELINKHYGKYLRIYLEKERGVIGKKPKQQNEFVQKEIFVQSILEAINFGEKEKSVIVGYALYGIEKWRLDNISTIVRLDRILSFLKETFKQEKYTEQDYEQKINALLKLKNIQNLTGF